ncbi:hypothetical protein ACYRFS_12850 [Listeria kieliensis]
MLEIEFTGGQGLDIQDGLILSYDKAILLCSRKNEELLSSERSYELGYRILVDKADIYTSKLIFPYEFFDFKTILEEEIRHEYSQGEADKFLTYFEQKLPKENFSWKKKNKVKLAKSIKEPVKQPKRSVDKGKKRFTINGRRLGKIGLGVLLLFVATFGTVSFLSGAKEEPQPTFQQLIKEGDYIKAVKTYPDKQEAVQDKLFIQALSGKEKDKENYEAFSKKFSSKKTKFDQSVLEGDYKKTIQEYEKKESLYSNDDERLEVVGYAYLKDKNLEKAKKLAEKSSNVDLEERIFKYEQLTLSIKKRQKHIEELQKDPIKNEAVIKKQIDLLFKDKEELNKM